MNDRAQATTPAICVDLDGTLLDDGGRIHPSDVAILAAPQGVTIIPATGRSLPSVRRTFQRNGLFLDMPIPFPMVLQNGAALYFPGEVLHAFRTLRAEVQQALLAVCDAHPDVTTFIYALEEIHVLWPNPVTDGWARRFNLETVPFVRGGQAVPFSKVMCIGHAPEPLHALLADLEGLPLSGGFSLPTVVEIGPIEINKGEGALELLSAMGARGVRLVAAGDGENDLGLFARSDLVFVPAASPPAMRAHAHYIVDVDRCGILQPILDILAQTAGAG